MGQHVEQHAVPRVTLGLNSNLNCKLNFFNCNLGFHNYLISFPSKIKLFIGNLSFLIPPNFCIKTRF